MAFISALVLQQDVNNYINSDGSYGYITPVPTPASGGRIDCDYWATPYNQQNIVGKGFKYTPCQPTDTAKPDVQSVHVVRIITSAQSTDWYCLGTSVQYTASASAADANAAPVPMPTAIVNILPSQNICNQNRAGLYVAVLSAPTLISPKNYYASGYFNGTALAALSGSGYATAALLVAAMNSLWSIVGTWTLSADNITVIATQAAGTGYDVLAAAITTA